MQEEQPVQLDLTEPLESMDKLAKRVLLAKLALLVSAAKLAPQVQSVVKGPEETRVPLAQQVQPVKLDPLDNKAHKVKPDFKEPLELAEPLEQEVHKDFKVTLV